MNKDEFKDEWKKFKGEINKWEQLSDDDLLEPEQLKSWPEDWCLKRERDEIAFPEKPPSREPRNNKTQKQEDPILAVRTHT